MQNQIPFKKITADMVQPFPLHENFVQVIYGDRTGNFNYRNIRIFGVKNMNNDQLLYAVDVDKNEVRSFYLSRIYEVKNQNKDVWFENFLKSYEQLIAQDISIVKHVDEEPFKYQINIIGFAGNEERILKALIGRVTFFQQENWCIVNHLNENFLDNGTLYLTLDSFLNRVNGV